MKALLLLLIRSRYTLLTALFYVCWLLPAAAQEQVIELSDAQPLQLAEFQQLQVHIEKDTSLQLQDILSGKQFKPLDKQIANFGVSSEVVWLKFTIHNQTRQPLQLVVGNPVLDYVDFYYPGVGGRYEVIKGGELTPFELRPIKHQNFIYNLHIPYGQTQTFYLRVKSHESIIIPIFAGTEEEVRKKNNIDDLVMWLYIMVLIVMIFYNTFIFSTVKDWSYFYYILYIAGVGLTQVCLHGFGYRYLWHNNIFITEQSVFWTGALSGITVALFVQRFLHVKERAPLAYKFFNGFIYLYVLAVVLALLRFYALSYLLIDVLAITGVCYILGFALTQVFKRYRPARFFIIAWFIFILAVMVFVLKDTGIVPYNFLTTNIVLIGSALEVILLSLALADKINTYKKEKEDSQAMALSVSQENERLVREQNIILETKVNERTEALQMANNDLNVALSSLKEAQTQLVEKEKMASLGQLTAGIAHEINNPINFVTSNIKPLKLDIEDLKTLLSMYEQYGNQSGDAPSLQEIDSFKKQIDIDYIHEEISSLLKGIEDGAARTAEIVKGLRTFSRLDESDVKYVDIHEGIDSTLVLLRNSIPPTVTVVKDYGDLPKVECYAGKINQVFMNILTNGLNAIKMKDASGEGTITITTRRESNGFVSIGIRDTGIGMPDHVKEKIFDPFFTTKDVGEGTGLGLSIVFSIIEKHHGRIVVESAPGKGAEFIIYLPLNIDNLPS
ncbi:GHKL domain-containing protein [Chitinophaga pendula]|uniref:sensor histidine kinase n=1 Tax=Chitinophaga TaxID=79328 RepID=UPI000BAF3BAA|nr:MULTISPECIES: 7TM diverse intracellular signaling domain-containing protein [Chitinophaga]ASZ10924.1 ATPase [Chitinophaga sp. MD30]UCJ06088.1 GHKL domain-containing protein [Chitinophaga pendula]